VRTRAHLNRVVSWLDAVLLHVSQTGYVLLQEELLLYGVHDGGSSARVVDEQLFGKYRRVNRVGGGVGRGCRAHVVRRRDLHQKKI
jgi:hypothetical protein